MNSVHNIQSLISNNELTLELQIEFAKMPPPTPDLVISRCNGKQNRSFRRSLYGLGDWMCGCNIRNAFFCYVCLLMNNSKVIWTSIGYNDLKNISAKSHYHGVSLNHLRNSLEVAKLRRSAVTDPLSHHIDSVQDVEVVRQNRNVLSKMIDAGKSCLMFDESDGSEGRDVGNCDFAATINNILKEHVCKNSDSVFSGLAENIHDDLLSSMHDVCLNLISKEIKQTDYAAAQIDTISDVNSHRLVVIVRYELKGEIHERFIGFQNLQENTVEYLSGAILHELRKVNLDRTPRKIISQSFNTGGIFSGKNDVQEKIKSVYRNADIIHSYSHELLSLVKDAASREKQIKIFFAYLEGFSSFFKGSKKYMNILNTPVKEVFSILEHTDLNSIKDCLQFLCDHKKHIQVGLDTIIDLELEGSVIRKAVALNSILKNGDFSYWLHFFDKIIPICVALNEELLQFMFKSASDLTESSISAEPCVSVCILKVLDVKRETARCRRKRQNELNNSGSKRICGENRVQIVSEVKEEITIVENDLLQEIKQVDNGLVNENGITSDEIMQSKQSHKVIADKVCDIIATTIGEHFSYTKHFVISALLVPSFFGTFKDNFPTEIFEIAVETYTIIEKQFFKNELIALYGSNLGGMKTVLKLLQYFYQYDLLNSFPETVKLAKIICTMPMMTRDSDRCFNTVARAKTFLKNVNAREQQINALAMCFLENSLMQNSANFDDLVIQDFSRKKGLQMNFLYL